MSSRLGLFVSTRAQSVIRDIPQFLELLARPDILALTKNILCLLFKSDPEISLLGKINDVVQFLNVSYSPLLKEATAYNETILVNIQLLSKLLNHLLGGCVFDSSESSFEILE